MKEATKPHRPNAKRLLNQIGSRYALSNMSLLLFLIPAFGSVLIFDVIRMPGNLGVRFLTATVGYMATVIPLLIARRWYPDKPRESKPAALMLVFVIAGLARGIALLLMAQLTGEYQPGDEVFRLTGAPAFTVIMMTVCVVLASNYLRHREALVNLAKERHRLQIASAGIRAKVEIQREELLSRVRSLLDPAISKVQQNLAGGSNLAVESLRSTVDEVVRPLSSELAETSDELELEQSTPLIREKAPLPSTIKLGEFILPLWGSLVTAVVAVAVAFLFEDNLTALFVIATAFFSMFAILWLAHQATKNLEVPPVAAAFLVPAIYALSLSQFHLFVPLFDWNFNLAQVNAFMVFGLLVGASLYFAQFAQYQRASTTEKLTAINQQLEILNGSLRQELWLNRRRTASLLHGPVQAALYASAMKLSQATEPSKELIAEVQRDIQSAIEKLNNPNNLELESISQVLRQIVEVWQGTADITIDLAPELEAVLFKQPLATESLVEVVREFITNAIRHGKATKISVTIYRLDEHRFAIEVRDNGEGLSPQRKSGFGSKLISELSLSWWQKRVDDTTSSYAEIVLGRDNL